jgi:hypothetical protein
MRIKWGDLKTADRIALGGLIIAAISVAIAFVQLIDPFSSDEGPTATTAATSQNESIAVNVKQLSQLDVCNGGNGSIYPQQFASFSDYERLIGETYFNQGLDWATIEQRHDEWVAGHGGIPANVTHVTITIQAKSDAAILITGLKFQVTRKAPVAGTHLIPAGECGGGQEVRKFAVNLDERDPAPRPLGTTTVSGTAQDNKGYVTDFPYKVSSTDPEYIELVVYTLENDCTWTATIEWIADGKAGSTEVKNGNAPFRLSSSKNSDAWEYNLTTSRVERAPTRNWTGRPPEEVQAG